MVLHMRAFFHNHHLMYCEGVVVNNSRESVPGELNVKSVGYFIDQVSPPIMKEGKEHPWGLFYRERDFSIRLVEPFLTEQAVEQVFREKHVLPKQEEDKQRMMKEYKRQYQRDKRRRGK